jgi:hypothetical protein
MYLGYAYIRTSCCMYLHMIRPPFHMGRIEGAYLNLPSLPRAIAFTFDFFRYASKHAVGVRRVLANAFVLLAGSRISYNREIGDYHTLMCGGKFALAPEGNVQDTWRVYEALDCGAIPVITDGGRYFSK